MDAASGFARASAMSISRSTKKEPRVLCKSVSFIGSPAEAGRVVESEASHGLGSRPLGRAHLTLLASASAFSRISSAQVCHFSTDCLTHSAISSLTASLAHSISLIGSSIHSSLVDGLRAEPVRYALVEGASEDFGGADRVQPKGVMFCLIDALTFAPVYLVIQRVTQLFFPIRGTEMEQQVFPLFERKGAPSVLPPSALALCHTYRDAVILCWEQRKERGMSKRTLAERAFLYAPHVSCYLNERASTRDLPGSAVSAFEEVCGNTAISQWHAANAKLTCLEEMQAMRALA